VLALLLQRRSQLLPRGLLGCQLLLQLLLGRRDCRQLSCQFGLYSLSSAGRVLRSAKGMQSGSTHEHIAHVVNSGSCLYRACISVQIIQPLHPLCWRAHP
jgi:hypothetical protein